MAAAGVTIIVMWPVMDWAFKHKRYAGLLYKLDSTKGIDFMDRVGAGHPSFWTAVGDVALILGMGGLGAAFAVNHRDKRGRSIMVSCLAFFTVFIYASRSVVSFFPFGFYIQPDLDAFVLAAAAGLFIHLISGRFSKSHSTIISFAVATLLIGSPYLLMYASEGNVLGLVMGLPLGLIGLPALLVVPLGVHAYDILTGASAIPGLNFGYPEMQNGMPVLKYAGTDIAIPFIPDMLIAMIIAITLHECFHGLLARAQKIKLKNTGLIFLSILPMGGFVEPDEKQFKKEKPVKQLRVYAVGSFANIFVVSVGLFLIANGMVAAGLVKADGFLVGGIVVPGEYMGDRLYANESPAYGVFQPGEVITNVDGINVSSFDDFVNVMTKKKPGDSITVMTMNKSVMVTLAPHYANSSYSFLGLKSYQDPMLSSVRGLGFAPSVSSSHLEPSLASSIFSILKWAFFLNLMLGIMNFTPLLMMLDGWFIYRGLFEWLASKTPVKNKALLSKALLQGFTYIMLGLFFLNALPYLV